MDNYGDASLNTRQMLSIYPIHIPQLSASEDLDLKPLLPPRFNWPHLKDLDSFRALRNSAANLDRDSGDTKGVRRLYSQRGL